MDASITQQNEMVTVAQAAAILTKAGDQIDPSNVSRYLARFPEIPQRKVGKFRYVGIAELMRHRNTNVMVSEKRGTRGFATEPAASAPKPPKYGPVGSLLSFESDGEEGTNPESPRGSNALNEANLQFKRLQIRNLELDQAEREGTLVPDSDVIAIASSTLEAFVKALEQAEVEMTQTFGREVGIAFRKARKGAQAHAARELIEMAKKFLSPSLAAAVIAGEGQKEP